ncbi:hypothetical protein ZEAMMB73_Zm00001d042834 [Zea mays]|jgi:hypothetical protein|uniref:Uncharacterized protein n=1 Tax=Zea mays TaxID=4577 RepID=A0A1D6N708_MAIZE|nr:hypothetical protein ZEAMMB73_Zm00001d042834 [Zea mays]ONM36372.1 hypothetical protein ZEAMMB73_Zm00001d042834 [Zea mays]ONM36373.1 hypothetical protein ZEAMMB73_Zm00001d042834 [Zea mays]
MVSYAIELMMPFWHSFIELIVMCYLLTMFIPALLDFHLHGMSSINKIIMVSWTILKWISAPLISYITN